MCRFYKVDTEWLAECEAMEAVLPDGECGNDGEAETNSPCPECGPCCRFLSVGDGFPGENVTYRSAPGNEHIISVDFDLSAVI